MKNLTMPTKARAKARAFVGGISRNSVTMSTDMDLISLQISNYQENCRSAQKALLSSLLISTYCYLWSTNYAISPYSIPLIGITINSKNDAIGILAILFFYSGLYSAVSTSKLFSIYQIIQDREVAKNLLYTPNLINSNHFIHLALNIIFLGTWYTCFLNAHLVSYPWQSVLLGAICTAPYFYVLKIGRSMRKFD